MSGGPLVFMVGEERPAMSISWAPPAHPTDSGFLVIFADLEPGEPGFEDLPTAAVCLHCLLEDEDADLGRGLDLAEVYGQVDWDPELDEWFIPDDEDAVLSPEGVAMRDALRRTREEGDE